MPELQKIDTNGRYEIHISFELINKETNESVHSSDDVIRQPDNYDEVLPLYRKIIEAASTASFDAAYEVGRSDTQTQHFKDLK